MRGSLDLTHTGQERTWPDMARVRDGLGGSSHACNLPSVRSTPDWVFLKPQFVFFFNLLSLLLFACFGVDLKETEFSL